MSKPKDVVLGRGVQRRSGQPVTLDEFYIGTTLHINVFVRNYESSIEGSPGTLIWRPDPPAKKGKKR